MEPTETETATTPVNPETNPETNVNPESNPEFDVDPRIIQFIEDGAAALVQDLLEISDQEGPAVAFGIAATVAARLAAALSLPFDACNKLFVDSYNRDKGELEKKMQVVLDELKNMGITPGEFMRLPLPIRRIFMARIVKKG